MGFAVDPKKARPGYCIELVGDSAGWRSSQCTNRKKFGDYCGTHSPEKKAERRKARGPTQFELEVAAARKRADRRQRLEAVVAAAREAIAIANGDFMLDGRPIIDAIERYDELTK